MTARQAPWHLLPLLLLLTAHQPSPAQTLGASNGLVVIHESGRVLQQSQIYVQQRGIGATNLDNLPKLPVDTSLAPAAIAVPVPVIPTPLPNDFRLSITNTDQIQNSETRTMMQSGMISITSSPLTIQLR